MSDTNRALIEKFYSSFNNRDWKTIQECYHDQATFYDPAFRNLNASEVRAMWQMLISRSTDLRVEYADVKADEEYGSCSWTAYYTFTVTGRKVENRIKAHFKFHEGKIIEHMDDFDITRWSRQALGPGGLLLGWSSAVKNKIHQQARKELDKYMRSEANSRNTGNNNLS